MAKSSTVYICQNCESSYPKWQGQCEQCGEWGTLVETLAKPKTTLLRQGSAGHGRSELIVGQELVKFSQVKHLNGSNQRFSSGIGELDRVLGPGTGEKSEQGIVPGAVMLIGGEPGIGKSTLLTQMVIKLLIENPKSKIQKPEIKTKNLKTGKSTEKSSPESLSSQKWPNLKILYVCGEESPQQISLRIDRMLKDEYNINTVASLGVSPETWKDNLIFCQQTNVDLVSQIIQNEKPSLVIIDSIQTMVTDELTGAAGSPGQLRESTDRLTTIAKAFHIPMFLVGHVTKDGIIAGPKILEHIVDAVLELSGERTDDLRILRTLKNRFGPTDEVGVFRVNESGLEEISNPSKIFLEHQDISVPGSATVCVMEGSRPLLVEVQALVVSSQLAMPRRVGRGVELSRIQVLSAILQKHCALPFGVNDVFLSVAGGFKVKEPAVDLGLCVAMVSSLKNKPLPPKTLFIGEVGLLGEIRAVSHLDRRIKEAKRLGYENIISRKTDKSVREVIKKLGL